MPKKDKQNAQPETPEKEPQAAAAEEEEKELPPEDKKEEAKAETFTVTQRADGEDGGPCQAACRGA